MRSKPASKPLSPKEALSLLEQHARETQDVLASRSDAGPDVLAYLAENGAAATRQAVAANPATPAESNHQLAGDSEPAVRKALAVKIGRLFPGLLAEEQKQLRDLTIATLEKLARDEENEVRAILAEEIKDQPLVPKSVIDTLAHDADPSVALPVIEFSPLLEDRDLIELVVATRASTILSAVARRKHLSGEVSDAVATTLDTKAVSALLANTDAAIRTTTLDKIIAQAAEVAEWHAPLVVRADLSKSAVKRLASFVGSALIDALAARDGLDESTRNHLKKKITERRVREAEAEAAVIEAARRAGTLNEAFVAEAVEECRKETVVRALAVLAKTDESIVRRLLESRSPKAAVALVWRAGLSMRVALKLQIQVMRLTGHELVHARRGVDFPLSDDEMRWHLGYFGIA
jgi:uncharacterized protein (DUF2336 family)